MHSTLELFSAKDIHSEGKVGFRSLPFLFLYYEYKIRNISIFYSLEFYFSQRAGEGRKSLHRPGLTPAYGLRRAKVVFSAPSIPFCIYHLYKFRELSSFYLQNYFPQRTGEGRYIFIYRLNCIKIRGEIFV